MNLAEYADEMTPEEAAAAAPFINLYVRHNGGFVDEQGVRDLLRLIAINARQIERRWKRNACAGTVDRIRGAA